MGSSPDGNIQRATSLSTSVRGEPRRSATDIRRLVALAYPAPSNDTKETIAGDAFLEAMRDKELSLKVRKEKEMLDQVFRTAVHMVAYQTPTAGPMTGAVSERG